MFETAGLPAHLAKHAKVGERVFNSTGITHNNTGCAVL
jgi:hypothetical protein